LQVDETWTTLELKPEQTTRLINSLKAAAANLRHPDLLELVALGGALRTKADAAEQD
jgi:hypothetical protein